MAIPPAFNEEFLLWFRARTEATCLLAEPCQADNPVLSIWQTDIFVSAPDLRTFLLAVFSRTVFSSGPSLLRLNSHDQKEVNEERKRWRHQDKSMYKNIPFWGDYCLER